MKRIEAVIRPQKLEAVKIALSEIGVTGLSVTDVRGSESREYRRFNTAYLMDLPMRVKVEVVVPDEDVEEIVAELERYARTGEHGDGMIFVLPMQDAFRIRTQERGDDALV